MKAEEEGGREIWEEGHRETDRPQAFAERVDGLAIQPEREEEKRLR